MGNVPAVDRQAWLHDEVKAFFEDGALLFKSGAIAVILEAQRINQDRDKKGGLNIRPKPILVIWGDVVFECDMIGISGDHDPINTIAELDDGALFVNPVVAGVGGFIVHLVGHIGSGCEHMHLGFSECHSGPASQQHNLFAAIVFHLLDHVLQLLVGVLKLPARLVAGMLDTMDRQSPLLFVYHALFSLLILGFHI